MDLIFIVFALSVLLFAIFIRLYLYLNHIHHYWKREKFPYIEPEFFYGNARGVGTDFVHADFWKNMYLKLKYYGPIAGVYLFYEPFAIITDLDLVKRILVKDFNNFRNRGLYFNERDDPASANLFNIEDEMWKELREKLTPAFTGGKLRIMCPIIAEISDQLISIMSKANDGEIEVGELLSRFSTDVIGNIAFGVDCKSLSDKNERFYKIGIKAAKKFTFFKRILTAKYPNLARIFRIRTIDVEASEFYKNVVHDTIEYRKRNKIHKNDFMGLLMENKSLTFNEIWAQSVIFFLAGFETTATKLTFCLYELGRNKNVQKRARDTVKEVLEKFDGKFSYDALKEMHFLEQCINETLRLYSPAASARRIAINDYEVPGTNLIIRKGTTIVIPVHGIHNDPDLYKNPEIFNPDRFSRIELSKRNHFAFLPFGAGPRGCIGMRFAMIEMKIAMAKILNEFNEIEIDERMDIPLKFNLHKVLLSPAGGVYLRFKK